MSADLMPTPIAPYSSTPAPVGKVIVVHSAKGGVGTTTVAVNIAAAIHSRGQGVCLLDLDLSCGDVALALRLEPRNSILDVLSDDPAASEAEPIDALRTTVRPGFDCILAPAQSTEAEELPAGVLDDLIPYLRGRYDAIVIDTPTAMSAHTRAALAQADALVLVATPDVAALRGLTVGQERAASTGAGKPVVALNHVQRREGMPASEIAAGLGVEIAVQIPRDPEVERAGNRGEALMLTQPASPFGIEIDRLVDRWCAPSRTPAKSRPLHRRRVISL